jgi:Domain of unknown function (DUF4055)
MNATFYNYPWPRGVGASEPDVATQSGERAEMSADLELIADIRAGAVAMRARAPKYLPQYAQESDVEYARRVASAPWRAEFVDALHSLTSKPFSKPVSFPDGTPDAITAFGEDVDGRGNSLHVFAKQCFLEGVAHGVHGILVSYPFADGLVTRADEKRANLKPYFVSINVNDIVALYTEMRGGREVVVHARIRECYTERDDGFGEKMVEQIVVYEPGTWARWQKNEATNKYELIAEGLIKAAGGALDEVPLTLFFTGARTGMLRTRPPLRDLADCQLELFRSLSRQDEILTFTGSPMLSGSGVSPPTPDPRTGEGTIRVGPKTILFAPASGDGKSGSWQYVQPAAANLVAINDHVESVVEHMRRLAMQPTTRKSGDVTATATSVATAQAHSQLESWAIGCRDAFEQAFTFVEAFLGVAKPTVVQIHTDFGVGDATNADVRSLLEAQQAEIISKSTVRDELVRRGILGPQFDADNEDQQIAEEALGLEPEQPIDPVNGRPIAKLKVV